MTLIETRDIDEKELSPYALSEWKKAGEAAQIVVQQSEKVWALLDGKPVLYVGVVRATLLGTPVLWFFLGKRFRLRHVRKAKRLLPTLFAHFPRVETYVECDWKQGLKFAEVMGFRPTMRADGQYMVYEGRR